MLPPRFHLQRNVLGEPRRSQDPLAAGMVEDLRFVHPARPRVDPLRPVPTGGKLQGKIQSDLPRSSLAMAPFSLGVMSTVGSPRKRK